MTMPKKTRKQVEADVTSLLVQEDHLRGSKLEEVLDEQSESEPATYVDEVVASVKAYRPDLTDQQIREQLDAAGH
jgi:hypothetical protein